MEERVQKRRRGEGKGEEEESIALGNTNQMSAEDTLGIILKMANKKTITDGARTPKPIKNCMNHDIDKILSFTAKLKDALINEQSNNSR